jgi:NADH-quinone oxidoreductase E subunit
MLKEEESGLPSLRDSANNEIEAILDKYPTRRSAVLPLCQLAQEKYGHMGPEAVQEVAEILELDPTEIHGLVGFYTLLRETPTGEHVIQVCSDFPCSLRGADRFIQHVRKTLAVEPGETTSDGLFTVETVMCVAACDRAPVVQIDLEYIENLDPDSFDEIIEQLRIIATAKTDKPDANKAARNRRL